MKILILLLVLLGVYQTVQVPVNYVGCFIDQTLARAIQLEVKLPAITYAACEKACKDKKTSHMGIQGDKCYCGSVGYGKYGKSTDPRKVCNPCKEDANMLCGNAVALVNSVYFIGNCVAGCEQCNGVDYNDCKKCKADRDDASDPKCNCKDKESYGDPLTGVCTKCFENCATCFAGGNGNCNTCKTQFVYVADQYSCVCENGKYKDDKAKDCKPCNALCNTCTGPNVDQCITCKPDPFVLKGTKCDCKPGFFLEAPKAVCTKCNNICLTCSGATDSTCLSCTPEYDLVGTKCICKAGTFFDVKTQKCTTCDPLCEKCTGPSKTECTSCKSGFNFDDKTKSCSCFPGTFLDKIQCKPCYFSCATCSADGSNACLSCKATFVTSGTQCVCPQGFFLDGQVCKVCDPKCQSCNGPAALNCLSCKTGSFLNKNSCDPCHAMCEQCEGPNANSCLSCKTPMLLNSKQCSCPDGMYQEGTICKNCHDDCTTCSGPLPSQCIKCNTKSDGLLKEYLKLATNKGNLGLSTIIREEDNVPLNGDSIVDVVLTFDTTGSMETYIAQMGAVLDKINSELVKKFVGKKLDIHYGIVAYRNHPNKDDVYLTYSHDLSDLRSIKEFLPKLKVSGGNDYEEAVVDALWIIAKQFSWRQQEGIPNQRFVVHFADQEGSGTELAQCLCGIKYEDIAAEFKKLKVKFRFLYINPVPKLQKKYATVFAGQDYVETKVTSPTEMGNQIAQLIVTNTITKRMKVANNKNKTSILKKKK